MWQTSPDSSNLDNTIVNTLILCTAHVSSDRSACVASYILALINMISGTRVVSMKTIRKGEV